MLAIHWQKISVELFTTICKQGHFFLTMFFKFQLQSDKILNFQSYTFNNLESLQIFSTH